MPKFNTPPPISVCALVVMWGIALSTKQPQLLAFVGMSAFALITITVMAAIGSSDRSSDRSDISTFSRQQMMLSESFGDIHNPDSGKPQNTTSFYTPSMELVNSSGFLRSYAANAVDAANATDNYDQMTDDRDDGRDGHDGHDDQYDDRYDGYDDRYDGHDESDEMYENNNTCVQSRCDETTKHYTAYENPDNQLEGFEPQFAPANIESEPLNRSNPPLQNSDLIKLERSMDQSSQLIDRNEYQLYKPTKLDPNPFKPPSTETRFRGLDAHESSYVSIDLSSFALQESCQKTCASACQKTTDPR